jgi:hypothetical protein
MSHGSGWRGACESTIRDRQRRWLWRLVRPRGHTKKAIEKKPTIASALQIIATAITRARPWKSKGAMTCRSSPRTNRSRNQPPTHPVNIIRGKLGTRRGTRENATALTSSGRTDQKIAINAIAAAKSAILAGLRNSIQ